MTSSTPSPSTVPGTTGSLPSSPSATSEKSRRYDRQLRLWGDHGQHQLERSRVCLVGGANATGCEVLKSLVLPGVGAFTIVDPRPVTIEDTGNNFFLDPESVGQSRGAVACNLLLEMNHEVRGDFLEESADDILKNRPDFFKSFSLVIATEISEKALLALSKLLWEDNIPLMIVKSYGFLGYIRLQIKEHPVVESHPDNELQDFRLDCPFPGLVEYMESQDLDTMTKEQHSHTPYLVVVYKFLEKWKLEHDGNIPKTYQEKREFKAMIEDGKRRNEEGIPEEEENFSEAMAAVNTILAHYVIPKEVQAILDDENCTNINPSSSDFWVLSRGIKDFVDLDSPGELPLSGRIPDMFSDSERYVQLQNVYREKAAQDMEAVFRRVQGHLHNIGRPTDSISEATVKTFCREAHHLRLVRGGASIEEEFTGESKNATTVASILEQDPESQLMYYFILRGVDRFTSKESVVPGASVDHLELDIGKLRNCVTEVLNDYSLSSVLLKNDLVHEVCRYGGAELHAMAGFIGGTAAHEAIKLLTGQYVPINNLFIFNTMTSESTSATL